MLTLERVLRLPLALVLVPALVLGLSACTAPDGGSRPDQTDPAPAEPGPVAPEVVELPWTQAFLEEAGLIAGEILVEGPPGLLQHIVVGQDPATQIVSTEATNLGLRTEVRAKPNAGLVKIEAQLDRLMLIATERLVVLERPGEVPVVVDASGDVLYTIGGGSERLPSLRLVGERPE